MVVASSTFSVPAEGVLFQTPSTKLLVNDQELGTATLYITENNVLWGGGVTASGVPTPTISLLYPTISLHAIQKDPSPALYMVLNYELRLPELNQGSGDAQQDDDDDFDADDQPITQLRFVPPNESDLSPMYAAMSQGQELHPDPTDEVDDDAYMDGEEFDDVDEEFEDAEESSTVADNTAERLRAMRLQAETNGKRTDDSEDADDDHEFVPPNESDLSPMYAAMSQGQELHPDPTDEVDDDAYMDGEEFDDVDEEFEDAEESSTVADNTAERLRAMRLQAETNGKRTDDSEDADDDHE